MSSKHRKIKEFDPSKIRTPNGQIFGLPFTAEESDVILIPVPWEVTVSYQSGTAKGPQAILDASYQIDVYDADMPTAWHCGIHLLPIKKATIQKNTLIRKKAEKCITLLEQEKNTAELKKLQKEVNKACEQIHTDVEKTATTYLKKGKIVGVVGGDHSTPIGLMRALAEQHDSFGILHIDSHCDLRKEYEGFIHSHASIMVNALNIPQVQRLVQIGIRDYCSEEVQRIQEEKGRIIPFPDRTLRRDMIEGKTWKTICKKIVKTLPQKVYISFDIDGLNPTYCPHTGTPVMGGLEPEQIFYLIEQIIASKRTIIGFDLNEVAPGKNDEWDANVGMRILYRLSILAAKSQKKI